MARLLLDTNHLTYVMQNQPQVVANYERAVLGGDQLLLSVVVYYEFLRGLREGLPAGADRRRAERALRMLTRGWSRLPVGVRAAERAADVWVIRRARGQVRPDDGDLLLIGQAAAAHAFLVTNDASTARDARQIGVPTLNWY